MLPILFVAACMATAGANWLGTLKWRRTAAAHWAERARLLWPARKCAGTNAFLLPVYSGALKFVLDGAFSPWCVATAVAAWFGVVVGTYPLDREIRPTLTFRQWLRIVIAAWSLRILYWGAWIGGTLLMPERFNWLWFLTAAGVLAFQVLLQRWLWRKLFALGGLLARAGNRLEGIVGRSAERMRVPTPVVWLAQLPIAAAYALPLSRELWFTTGLMEICDDEEISAICAHELAHLTESRAALAMRLLGSLSLFPLLFVRPLLNSLGFPVGVLLPLFLVLAVVLPVRKLRQRMEKRADSVAAEQQSAAGIYARALEKIYRENQMPAVSDSHGRIHPHLYDRMLAAGIQPDFPRPKPPGSTNLAYIALWAGMGALIGLALARSGFSN
jgi:Zn-dependent protease with chaperone function